MKYFMHVFFKRCLAAAAAFLMVGTAMAQSDVTMEVTDIYGDTQQVPLSGNMTIYVPQNDYNRTFLVMCDAAGTPVWSIPMSQLSSIRYLGAPVSTATPELPEEYEDYPYLTWQIQGKDYRVVHPGEWHLSADLSTLTLRMADGKSYRIPLSAMDAIRLNEQVGLAHYMQKWVEEARIYNWAFWNGSIEAQDMMHMNFYAYVPEHRQLNCSLLVPDDEALSHWIDVITFESRKPRMLNLTYMGTGNFPFNKLLYRYDPATGTLNSLYPRTENISNDELTSRLGILLRSHLIIHRPEDGTLGLLSGNEYFQAIDGSIVRVVVEDGQLKAVQGTFQLWNQAQGFTTMNTEVGGFEGIRLDRCNIKDQRAQDGGWIYRIDSPMDATPLSAYAVLSADETEANPFRRFLELCMPDDEVLNQIVPSNYSSQTRENLVKSMKPFVAMGGNDLNLSYVKGMPFTLYVPTNEAIEQEIAAGRLSTWEDVAADLEACQGTENGMSGEDSLRISQKVETVLNFIRAHVQFGVEIADQLPFERTHNTVLVLPKTLRTPLLTVKSTGKGQLSVTDELGHTRNVLDAHKNIFVRDMHCVKNYKDASPTGMMTMNGITLNEYATGVIHQIDGVLSYKAE